jgi:hypothetical protein
VRKIIKNIKSEIRIINSVYKGKPLYKKIAYFIYTSDLFSPFFDFYYKINSYFINIGRVIRYTPVIWRHRNWDYGFIFKFNQTLHEDLYRGLYIDGHHVFNEKDTRRLKTTIELLKRLSDDEYEDHAYGIVEEKYGSPNFEFKDGYLKLTRTKKLTEKEEKELIALKRKLYKDAEKARERDLDMLFLYIKKYNKKWWD